MSYNREDLPSFLRRHIELADPPTERLDFIPPGSFCWEWQKSLNNAGYGQVKKSGRVWNTHRLVYHRLVERLPQPGKARRDEGNVILDHMCENRRCCNPAHLEKITQSENIIRGARHRD